MDQALLEAAQIHSESKNIIVQALRELAINSIDLESKAAAILSRLAHANLLLERYDPKDKSVSIKWIDIDDDLPDDEIAVLMHIEECERPFFGYKIGDQWWHDCGDVVAGTVLHWADLPEVPE